MSDLGAVKERITPKSMALVTGRGYDSQWIHDPNLGTNEEDEHKLGLRPISPGMLSVIKSLRYFERKDDLTMLDILFGVPLLLGDTVIFNAQNKPYGFSAELQAVGPAGDNLKNGRHSKVWVGPNYKVSTVGSFHELEVPSDPVMHGRIARIIGSPSIAHQIHAMVLSSKALLTELDTQTSDFAREIVRSRENHNPKRRKTPVYLSMQTGLNPNARGSVFVPGEALNYSLASTRVDSRRTRYSIHCEGPKGHILSAHYLLE